MTEELPAHPASGRVLDAQLHLLNRSVRDIDGLPVAFVVDLELAAREDGLEIESLVVGSGLLQRIFGGRAPRQLLHRFRWDQVADIGTRVVLGGSAADHVVRWTERWTSAHIIGRIPGGRHDPS